MTSVAAMHPVAGAQVDTSVLGLRNPDESWRPLPEWARYHLETGLAIGRLPAEAQRCTLAVVIPTAEYAAALCAVGIVLAAYERQSAIDAPQLFREFSQLPIGTPLTLREGRRLLTGRLIGVREQLASTGEPGLGIQTENRGSGGLTRWIPAPDISRVSRADREEVDLPNRQKGRRLQDVNRFAQDVLFPLDAQRFTEPGNLACLVVGSRRRLLAEAEQAGFATRPSDGRGKPAAGVLNHLLRLRGSSGARGAFRTDVLAAQASRIPASIQVPSHVVFDGASGYLKWRGRFATSHAIVVLDRTDPRYDEAAGQLHRDYIRRSPGSLDLIQPNPPVGVEVLRFGLAA